MTSVVARNIQSCAAELLRRNLFAVIVPTADPHNSEYVADCFQRRAKLSGFHGSAGTCVVTCKQEARLWTDGRYWLEADATLEPGWTLMKAGAPSVDTIEEWLTKAVAEHKKTTMTQQGAEGGEEPKIGIDASTELWTSWRRLEAAGLNVVPTEGNLVDTILNKDGTPSAPPVVKAAVVPMPEQYAGRSVSDKIAAVAAELRKARADVTVMSMLCETAWLLNLRNPSCSDIPYAPTFFAYSLVTSSGQCVVFVDKEKLSEEAAAAMAALSSCVQLRPYGEFATWLKQHKDDTALFGAFGKTAQLSESTASYGLYHLLQRECGFTVRAAKAGIVEKMKAIKNDAELRGMRAAHVRDGVALTRFLAWLHKNMSPHTADEGEKTAAAVASVVKDEETDEVITEVSAAEKLLQFRRSTGGDMFCAPSFETIAGTGGNGAIVHYRCASAATPVPIDPRKMFLCDSGGQYWDGTTDVTRTVVFHKDASKIPKHWRTGYTLVLKGHIRLNTTPFPGQGQTTGHRLDTLARMDLWAYGMNYAHGTGHGVGAMLNVHEGPFGIGSRPRDSDPGLFEKSIVSNEPGLYVSGEFGIRIENLDEIVEVPTRGAEIFGEKSGVTQSLRLKSITMAPLCRSLIDKELLTPAEVQWVDDYHKQVLAAVRGAVEKEKDVLEFLEDNCAPL